MMTELPPLDSSVLPPGTRARFVENVNGLRMRAGGPSKLDWTCTEALSALGH